MIEEQCKGVHCVDLGESFQSSNAYLLAKFGFYTAENEPSKVCPIEQCAADEGALHRLGAIASVQGQYDKAEGSAPSLRVLHHHSP